VLVVSGGRHARREPHDLTDGELGGRVYRLAGCAGSRVDPDDWFPETLNVAKARDQAAHAIAVCARCPVRPDCLELSLRHAFGVGAHGVWGGLVEEERRAARRRWRAGTASPNSSRTSPRGYGETSRWLSTLATPGAAAAAALAALARLRPVHLIGQAYDMSEDGGRHGMPTGPEEWRFLDVARSAGAIGASFFDAETATAAEWAALGAYPWGVAN
jgi:WhiB family redox-sensing transcriptional regulator